MVDRVIRLEERPSDAHYVERALAGELPAKRTLFERHVEMATGIAFRLTGSDTDVEDIVQDSFMAAFESLHRLEQAQAFRAWLAAIVTRTAISALRRRRLLTRLGLLRREPVRLESLVNSAAPSDVMADLRAVYAVLDRFPPSERVVLLLRRFEQLSLEEIAEQTGYSLATVKRRLSKAESRLNKALIARKTMP